MGGLVAEWLDDLMGVLPTYLAPLDLFATDRIAPCEGAVEGDETAFFPIFSCMNNGLHFFPSRLARIPNSSEQVPEVISLTNVLVNKDVDKQRKHLLTLYETFGKALSQMIRQDNPIPEAFSSPLLIMYLVDGPEKMVERADINLARWVRLLEELDYDTYGARESSPIARLIGEIVLPSEEQEKTGSFDQSAAKQKLFDEVVIPYVLTPRRESLDAIRRGFVLVDLTERLARLTVDQFTAHLCSRSFVHSGLLLPTLDIDDSVPGFRATVSAAIARLEPEQCARLLKFATGSAHFQDKLYIAVKPKLDIDSLSPDDFNKYPKYPFVTSLTCCNFVYVPCPLLSQREAFTEENVLENLLSSLDHGMFADFDDKAAQG